MGKLETESTQDTATWENWKLKARRIQQNGAQLKHILTQNQLSTKQDQNSLNLQFAGYFPILT